jgi:DNA (cytosine-5)-methyltransferase 1
MLVEETRAALVATGKPYVIENVPGAPLVNPLMLCGTMFGLRVIRHRLFECDPAISFAPASCNHDGNVSGNRNAKGIRKNLENFRFLTIVGNDYIADDGRVAMGIPWMVRRELSQAIPPAYTEFIGKQLRAHLAACRMCGKDR